MNEDLRRFAKCQCGDCLCCVSVSLAVSHLSDDVKPEAMLGLAEVEKLADHVVLTEHRGTDDGNDQQRPLAGGNIGIQLLLERYVIL